MKSRNTQWIKGFELLDQREGDISSKINYLEKYFDRPLPQPIKDYLLTYQPIDIYDYAYYVEEVYFYEPGILIVHTAAKCWGNQYSVQWLCNIDHIIQELKTYDHSSLGSLQRHLQIIPIASNGSPDGSIVYSLNEKTLGKIYTLVDYQTSEICDDHLIADNIQQFILHLEVVPVSK